MLCRGQLLCTDDGGSCRHERLSWALVGRHVFFENWRAGYRAVSPVLCVLDQGVARVRYNIALWYA